MKRNLWRLLVSGANFESPLGPQIEAREVWAIRTEREVKSRGLLGLNRQTGEVTFHPWPRKISPSPVAPGQ